MVKSAIVFHRKPVSLGYRASPAIWDHTRHTVLPATRHRWTCPASTPVR